jgi:hypothetical protein
MMPSCDCGLRSGSPTWAESPCSEVRHRTTVIYFLPPDKREGRTFEDRGDFPVNGELRLRVTPQCAARMVAEHGAWVEVIGDW